MRVRGGGETAQLQHSCELMNLSAHCGLCRAEPTLLQPRPSLAILIQLIDPLINNKNYITIKTDGGVIT